MRRPTTLRQQRRRRRWLRVAEIAMAAALSLYVVLLLFWMVGWIR